MKVYCIFNHFQEKYDFLWHGFNTLSIGYDKGKAMLESEEETFKQMEKVSEFINIEPQKTFFIYDGDFLNFKDRKVVKDFYSYIGKI